MTEARFNSDEALRERLAMAKARGAARKFIIHLRNEGWAEGIPEEWASMSDEQIKEALTFLKNDPRVRQRPDWKWERV